MKDGMHVTECVLLFFDKWDDEEDESSFSKAAQVCKRLAFNERVGIPTRNDVCVCVYSLGIQIRNSQNNLSIVALTIGYWNNLWAHCSVPLLINHFLIYGFGFLAWTVLCSLAVILCMYGVY